MKKRRTVKLCEKLEIICMVKAGETICTVARYHLVNESTLCSMMKNKNAVRKTLENSSPESSVNVVKVAHDPYVPQMEKALCKRMEDWFHMDITCNEYYL